MEGHLQGLLCGLLCGLLLELVWICFHVDGDDWLGIEIKETNTIHAGVPSVLLPLACAHMT